MNHENMKRVFVCSPLRAANGYTIEDNIAYAKKLCHAAVLAGVAPFAPHVFYTQFLDDGVAVERNLGIKAGISWLDVCDEIWVAAANYSFCSSGMRAEVDRAMMTRPDPIPVVYNPEAFANVLRPNLKP